MDTLKHDHNLPTGEMQKTILVVDDDPMHIELMTDLLTTANRTVVSALDGVEAIALLNAQNVHLIVCDIEMPRMNGFALHKEIQRDERLKLIPFMFLTGLDDPNSLSYIHERPYLVVLHKSDIEALTATINKHIPQ